MVVVSTVLGTALPGANTIYLSQEVRFIAPVFIGDTLTAEVEVLSKRDDKNILTFKTIMINQEGQMVLDGQAKVLKP